MNILLTGSDGFIGKHLTTEFLKRGHRVEALTRPKASPRPSGASVTGHEATLADFWGTVDVLRTLRPDAVVHLAWNLNPESYLTEVEPHLESLNESVTLLRACRRVGVERLVLGGTCLENLPEPRSVYAQAKRAIHDLAMCAFPNKEVVCAHIFSTYGPGEHPGRAVPTIISSLLRGAPVKLGSGNPLRDYLHVADVAAALASLTESPISGAVDVCSGDPRTLRELFLILGELIGRTELLSWGEAQLPPEAGYSLGGDETALVGLGWKPAWTLREGLADAIEWWRTTSSARTGRTTGSGS